MHRLLELIVIGCIYVTSSCVYSAGEECHGVMPSYHIFRSAAVVNPVAIMGATCTQHSIGGVMYTNCSSPTVLTDGLMGASKFTAAKSSSYYRWVNNDGKERILFAFPKRVLLSAVQLHFYVDKTMDIGLPKVRISLVPGSFQVTDVLDTTVHSTITTESVSGPAGLQNLTAMIHDMIQTTASQVLLRIDKDSDKQFVLTEIKFCQGELIYSHILLPRSEVGASRSVSS